MTWLTFYSLPHDNFALSTRSSSSAVTPPIFKKKSLLMTHREGTTPFFCSLKAKPLNGVVHTSSLFLPSWSHLDLLQPGIYLPLLLVILFLSPSGHWPQWVAPYGSLSSWPALSVVFLQPPCTCLSSLRLFQGSASSYMHPLSRALMAGPQPDLPLNPRSVCPTVCLPTLPKRLTPASQI